MYPPHIQIPLPKTPIFEHIRFERTHSTCALNILLLNLGFCIVTCKCDICNTQSKSRISNSFVTSMWLWGGRVYSSWLCWCRSTICRLLHVEIGTSHWRDEECRTNHSMTIRSHVRRGHTISDIAYILWNRTHDFKGEECRPDVECKFGR